MTELRARRLCVQDAMTRDVVSVRETWTVGAAADHVLRHGHTHLVVLDEDGGLVDIISVHLLTAALLTRLVSRGQPLADVVAEPTTVDHHAGLADVSALMMERSVDVVGVVDGAGELVGVLTWSDIARCAVRAEGRAQPGSTDESVLNGSGHRDLRPSPVADRATRLGEAAAPDRQATHQRRGRAP